MTEKPLTIDELREQDFYQLVREHGEYSFYIGLFNRFKIERSGTLICGGTCLDFGVQMFNNYTGLDPVDEELIRSFGVKLEA